MKKASLSLGFVLIIIGIALLINVGHYGVVETSDARYAEIGREMALSGDYIHPNLLNIHHYHKPPFTYQITALGYKIFGINSFGARFFLQLSVLLQIFLVYQIAFLLFRDKKLALLSSVIYSSFPLVLISSRNLTTDSFLTSFVLLSLYFWLKYYQEGRSLFLYLFAFSMGMGFYTKGPVIFIITFIFIGLYSYLFPKKKNFTIHHLIAFILFLLVGFWWYIYLAVENTDFIHYFLGKQTVDRFAKNAFNRSMPWWYFVVLVPLTAAPWLLIFPILIKNTYTTIKKEPRIKLLILSILIPLFFFSLSTSKRILYVLPFYIFLAILSAYFYKISTKKQQKYISFFVSTFYIILSIGIIGLKFFYKEVNIPNYLLISGMLIIAIISIISIKSKLDYDSKIIYNTLLFSIFILITSSAFMASNALLINSPKPLTDFIKKEKLLDRKIYIYNSRQPSIAFELNKSIISLYKDSRDLNREVQFEQDDNWKKYLINLNNVQELSFITQEIQEKPSLLISYKAGNNDKTLDSLTKYFSHKKSFQNYTLYY